MTLSIVKRHLPASLVAFVVLVAVAMMLTVPGPARAEQGGRTVKNIFSGAINCVSNLKTCTNRDRNRNRAGGAGDAIALTSDQKMMVQGGLQNLGFYTGAIDGAIGAGTRASIRNYQTAIGVAATGGLTAVQINDLAALSPQFVQYPLNDANLFEADIAPDLDRSGMIELQAALNREGMNAGPEDGAMGTRTQNAIKLYKLITGLPGEPLPTRRLLAHLQGVEAALPAGIERASVPPEGFAGDEEPTAGENSDGGAGAQAGASQDAQADQLD